MYLLDVVLRFLRIRRKVARARIVIDSDGNIEECQVSPRIANAIRILARASERLSRPKDIKLAMNCDGTTSVKIRIVDETLGELNG